jgi:anti-sigma regulatory factor (Ser/Thr protein kinase)
MSGSVASEPGIDLVGRPAVHLPGPEPARAAVLAAAPGPFLPHRARELALVACRGWGLGDVADSAALVADELVTNAVMHAQTFLELHVAAPDGELEIAVHDRDPGFEPGWWDREPEDGSREPRGAGYGLCLVRLLAARYGGYQHPDGGKVMWATLATSPHPATTDRTDAARSTGSPAPDAALLSVLQPVRRTIVVNGARTPVSARRRERWRLDLMLGWLPRDPNHVDLTLRPTPLHPGLPRGHWRARRDIMRAGLTAPAGDGDVRIYPDPASRTALLELAADPPQHVHCPLPQLRAFLDAVDAAAGAGRPGGEAAELSR